MNETLFELLRFHPALEEFIGMLKAMRKERDQAEQALVGLWDDDFARSFTARHKELDDPVNGFVTGQSQAYLDFLEGKIRALQEYLHG